MTRTILMAGAAALTCGSTSELKAQTAGSVVVTVAKDAEASRYRYTIVNNTTRSIVALQVGKDHANGNCELLSLPLGFTLEDGVPSASASAPSGWTVDAFVDEESPFACVDFGASDTGAVHGILPGQTRSGFAVTAAAADWRYQQSHFSAILDDGTIVTGRMQPARPE